MQESLDLKEAIRTEEDLLRYIRGIMLESWMTPPDIIEDLASALLEIVKVFYRIEDKENE